jgi:hypothetical protein
VRRSRRVHFRVGKRNRSYQALGRAGAAISRPHHGG